MSWRKWKSMVSIGQLMTSVTVGITLAFLAGIVMVLYSIFRSTLTDIMETNAKQSSAQVAATINTYIEDMYSALEDVVAMEMAQRSSEEREEYYGAVVQIRNDLESILFYSEQGILLEYYAGERMVKKDISRNLSFDASWIYSSQDVIVSSPHVENIFVGSYPWVVTVAQRLPDNTWVALDFSFSGIARYIDNVGVGQHGYCYLLNSDGTMVYHPQQQLIYSGLREWDGALQKQLVSGTEPTISNGGVLYSVCTTLDSRWHIVSVSYVRELIKEPESHMIATMMLCFVLAVAVAVVIVPRFTRKLSRPLEQLANAMGEFEKGEANFHYEAQQGIREVNTISESFDHMVVRLKKLMEQIRQEEIALRKTELSALQAQINPHFLYNTLDSIEWMCEDGRAEDAGRMVEALATLFRISISKGQELIPIAKELEHAESYLYIQQIRYKKQFDYTITVDEGVEDYLCNKITLQPIIENSILHGMNLTTDEGHIDIAVRDLGDAIEMSIADDGLGMSAEQCEAILQHEPGRSGIGIKNVNDRIQIYFGKEYGISIKSEPDMGTTVHIRMPKVKEGGYELR